MFRHLDDVASLRNHTLHVVLGRIMRGGEYDDFTHPWLSQGRDPHVGSGQLRAVEELVDQKEVAHEQRPFHGRGRNRKRIDDEEPGSQQYHEHEGRGLQPLVDDATASAAVAFVWTSSSTHGRALRPAPTLRPRLPPFLALPPMVLPLDPAPLSSCRSARAAASPNSPRNRPWSRNRSRRLPNPPHGDRSLFALPHRRASEPPPRSWER